MTDQEKTWLQNLKAGDDVILAACYHLDHHRKVHRTTPAQIIINENGHAIRYLRRNGRRIGPSSGWLAMPEVTKC